jgi:hypothetical protein
MKIIWEENLPHVLSLGTEGKEMFFHISVIDPSQGMSLRGRRVLSLFEYNDPLIIISEGDSFHGKSFKQALMLPIAMVTFYREPHSSYSNVPHPSTRDWWHKRGA